MDQIEISPSHIDRFPDCENSEWFLKVNRRDPDSSLYRVVLPYIPRNCRVPVSIDGIAKSIFPHRETTPYGKHQVIDILRIFNDKWLSTLRWPPPQLEPWAELITKFNHEIDVHAARPKNSFTLKEHVYNHFMNVSKLLNFRSLDKFYMSRLADYIIHEKDQAYRNVFLFSRTPDISDDYDDEDDLLDME